MSRPWRRLRAPSIRSPLFAATAVAAAVAAMALLAGCEGDRPAPPSSGADSAPTISFAPTRISDLASWRNDDPVAALSAFRRSCTQLTKVDPGRAVSPGAVGGVAGDWASACAAAAAVADTPEAARVFFEASFDAWRVSGDEGEIGLFTGYFEPELDGSLSRRKGYDVPLHARPADLVLVDLGNWRDSLKGERIAGRVKDGRLRPYDSREEIMGGALGKDAEVVVWLDDPIDAFFLHIQGSGRVRLTDGSILRVGYDGHNGHVYYAVGRWLVQEGLVAKEDMSLQAIRDWMTTNPDRRDELMNRNPSYIFFRRITGDGPIGAQGVALTAGRSLAVDRRFIPLGAPVWVDIDYRDEKGSRLNRLMVAQDTGGAIRGAVRGDVFWGPGAPAEALAGPMAAKGSYIILLPKGVRPTPPN